MKIKSKEENIGFAKTITAKSIELIITDCDPKKEVMFKNSLTTKLISKLLEKKIVCPKSTFSLKIFEKNENIIVKNYTSDDPIDVETGIGLKITFSTQLIINTDTSSTLNDSDEKANKKIKQFIDFGYHKQKLSKFIQFYLDACQNSYIGVAGIMITGEKGSGKTELVQQISSIAPELINVLNFTCKSFLSNKTLEADFLKTKQPFIIIIDDLEEKSKEILSKMIELFEICRNLNCLVIGTSRSENSSNFEGLIGPGKFELDIEIETLSKGDRSKIIQEFLKGLVESKKEQKNELPENLLNILHSILDEQIIEGISLKTSGFVIYDIKCMIREIEFLIFAETKNDDKTTISFGEMEKNKNIDNSHEIALAVVKKAFNNIGSRTLKDFSTNIEKVKYDEIGGYEIVKRRIKSVVEMPLKNPEKFLQKGIKPSKGILLYGPPGCSKTMFAKAIATESNLNFISVKGPEMFNKYVGSSEKKVRELFKKARYCAPCIIFFDEIDSIASKRDKKNEVGDRILTQLLTEIDGVENTGLANNSKSKSISGSSEINRDFFNGMVVVIGATNRPECLDPAILRPGRFDELIYISLPDFEARKKILSLSTKKMPLDEDVSIEKLTSMTDGYSGAEIVQLCKEAAMQSIYKDEDGQNEKISMKDFNTAFFKVPKRIPNEMIRKFEMFDKNEKIF